jgi:hypothetical protein
MVSLNSTANTKSSSWYDANKLSSDTVPYRIASNNTNFFKLNIQNVGINSGVDLNANQTVGSSVNSIYSPSLFTKEKYFNPQYQFDLHLNLNNLVESWTTYTAQLNGLLGNKFHGTDSILAPSYTSFIPKYSQRRHLTLEALHSYYEPL